MKTYAIIPSRFGSSRFPGKPLAVLAGKPLVAWVVEAVKKARGFDTADSLSLAREFLESQEASLEGGAETDS